MEYYFEAAKDPHNLKVDLVETDLDVAITFVKIARESTNEEKTARSKQNARRAYDAVLHYLSSATLTRLEQEHITTKMTLLKSALSSLGESFM